MSLERHESLESNEKMTIKMESKWKDIEVWVLKGQEQKKKHFKNTELWPDWSGGPPNDWLGRPDWLAGSLIGQVKLMRMWMVMI